MVALVVLHIVDTQPCLDREVPTLGEQPRITVADSGPGQPSLEVSAVVTDIVPRHGEVGGPEVTCIGFVQPATDAGLKGENLRL